MISFTLNNRLVSVDAAPSTPLLWAIRDHVGLTGTKYGCGAGLCGAFMGQANCRRLQRDASRCALG